MTYLLAKNGFDVTLIESNKQLGGSWNSQWKENKYWSENSPRVLSYSGYTKKFLDDIGIKKTDVSDVYGTSFETKVQLIKVFIKNLYIKDYIYLLKGIFKYGLFKSDLTVDEYFKKYNFSSKGKKILRVLCITLCDTPENTNINNFIGVIKRFSNISFEDTGFKQYKDPNKWHQLFEKKMNKKDYVDILKNCKVTSLLTNGNKVIGVKYIQNNITKELKSKNVILCTQSTGLKSIIQNSNDKVKNNWKNWEWFKNWVDNTYYIGYGFQLHFKEKVKFPDQWCWSCMGKWSIIILPVSKWLTQKSKDPNIKTVWSCCIIDMDTKGSLISKTANDCSHDEIKKECLHQIKQAHRIPTPEKFTISDGLKKENGKWMSQNTGFTVKNTEYLPMKGKLDNLYALGCFTKTNIYGVSNKELAIASTIKFLKRHNKNLTGIYTLKTENFVIFILLVTLIVYNVLKKKKLIKSLIS